MARFGSVTELAAFLGNIDPTYAGHAAALWQRDIRTSQQLANFSEPHYLACGVPVAHIDDIQASAGRTGELFSLYQHHFSEAPCTKESTRKLGLFSFHAALRTIACCHATQHRASRDLVLSYGVLT